MVRNYAPEAFLDFIGKVLKGGFDIRRFPAFCATHAEISSLLQVCSE